MINRWLEEALDFFERYLPSGMGPRSWGGLSAEDFSKLLEDLLESRQALSRGEKRLALQRKWALAFADQEVPEDIKTLQALIPSRLDQREATQFLKDSLEEAKSTFVWTLNTSWTKANFWERAEKAGVHHALNVFDRQTRKGLEKAIRYLTD